jgi:hypothetical protein
VPLVPKALGQKIAEISLGNGRLPTHVASVVEERKSGPWCLRQGGHWHWLRGDRRLQASNPKAK